MNFVDGECLLLDKPIRWTSFDLVNKVRWLICHYCDIKKLKVGHAGTLDPLATGLMIICTGKKTKQIEQLAGQDKEYIATIQFGAFTPSFDLETPPSEPQPVEHLTPELIQTTLTTFIGEQMQEPPSFSAVKVNGKRSYTLARQGNAIPLQQKKITIYDIQPLHINMTEKQIELRIRCSKGTYIRAIVRDLALKMNTGAHLIQLTRTQIGNFNLQQALTPQQFEQQLKTTLEQNPIP